MMAHHLLSIVGLSWCLFGGYLGTELLATIGGAEITNPLLQLRWFLRETGHYNSVLGDVVDLTFMLSFAFFRIGFGSVLLYSYFRQVCLRFEKVLHILLPGTGELWNKENLV